MNIMNNSDKPSIKKTRKSLDNIDMNDTVIQMNDKSNNINDVQTNLLKTTNEIENNWDEGNSNTLNDWIRDCNKQQFIYQTALGKLISASQKIQIALLIISAIQTLITVSNLGLPTDNIYLVWSFKIALSLISGITYVLTQVMTLKQFASNIKDYTTYTETIEKFLGDLTSIADMKISLRPDGNKFITEKNSTYEKIFSNSPYISQVYWNEGIKEYNNYIQNNDGNNYYGRTHTAHSKFIRHESSHSTYISDTKVKKITTKS